MSLSLDSCATFSFSGVLLAICHGFDWLLRVELAPLAIPSAFVRAVFPPQLILRSEIIRVLSVGEIARCSVLSELLIHPSPPLLIIRTVEIEVLLTPLNCETHSIN